MEESEPSACPLNETHWCNFCGRGNANSEIEYMIVGHEAAICNICVEFCRDIVGEWRRIKDASRTNLL